VTPIHLVKFDLEEMTALDVTCAICGSVIHIPISSQSLDSSVSCIGCKQVLWDDSHPVDKIIGGLLGNLKKYRDERKFYKCSLGVSLVYPGSPFAPKVEE
jgi:ribosomal protein S27E